MPDIYSMDFPQVGASVAPAGASASVALPANTEYVRLATTANVSFRIGVGAQTAVATDQQLSPNESLVIRLSDPSITWTLAAIGTATVTATRVFPV